MNVIKCVGGHFFDRDKYDLCPHCGAGTDVSSVQKTENKKSHIPFWGKRKNEPDNESIVEMPEGTIGKTFGVFDVEFSKEALSVENRDAGQTSRIKENESPWTSECNKDAGVHEKSSYIEMRSLNNKEQEVIFENSSDSVPKKDRNFNDSSSLNDAIKKATYSNEGKTVGFFSATTNNSNTCESEPVVGWLVCIKGDHFGESFNIFAGRNSVGRGDSNKINLFKDETVSRSKHAWLTYEPKKREFFMQPGESSGLSYLNGDNVMEARKMKDRDILEFGNGKYMLIPLCSESFSWEDYIDKEQQ